MLETILKTKREELKTFTLPEKATALEHYSLKTALLNPHRSVGLIAEVKKASPSKGEFTDHIDPVTIAGHYVSAGADAVSVLTDRHYFQGSREYLTAVKQAVHIPVLRKDFIIDPIQIEESERIGADAILLIVAALGPKRLYDFYQEACASGLECLVEVHNREELRGLLDVFQPPIIGINNRDLHTFHTSLDTTLDLLEDIPNDSVVVSESGILHPEDITTMKEHQVNAVLVGEALMTAATPLKGIHTLYGETSL